jgi:hypothetical protein
MAKVDNYSTGVVAGRSLALLFGVWEECSHFNKMDRSQAPERKGMSG